MAKVFEIGLFVHPSKFSPLGFSLKNDNDTPPSPREFRTPEKPLLQLYLIDTDFGWRKLRR